MIYQISSSNLAQLWLPGNMYNDAINMHCSLI